jgi:hypothetical protein
VGARLAASRPDVRRSIPLVAALILLVAPAFAQTARVYGGQPSAPSPFAPVAPAAAPSTLGMTAQPAPPPATTIAPRPPAMQEPAGAGISPGTAAAIAVSNANAQLLSWQAAVLYYAQQPSPPASAETMAQQRAQYFSNGAAALAVPSSGPGAAYFENGASLLTVPSSVVPFEAPSAAPAETAAPPTQAPSASAQPPPPAAPTSTVYVILPAPPTSAISPERAAAPPSSQAEAPAMPSAPPPPPASVAPAAPAPSTAPPSTPTAPPTTLPSVPRAPPEISFPVPAQSSTEQTRGPARPTQSHRLAIVLVLGSAVLGAMLVLLGGGARWVT